MKITDASGTVILADGSFPSHETPLRCLRNASRVICCDGSAAGLLEYGMEPFAIVGDCDSLTPEISLRYKESIFRFTEQETNDLTKAVKWCVNQGMKDIVILGATGKREDHTIGNISLLAEYAKEAAIRMITDTGIFLPLLKSTVIDSFRGQQVSVFSVDTETEITSEGLKYPLNSMKLANWWQATLNEATGDTFKLSFKGGPLLVFLKFGSD